MNNQPEQPAKKPSSSSEKPDPNDALIFTPISLARARHASRQGMPVAERTDYLASDKSTPSAEPASPSSNFLTQLSSGALLNNSHGCLLITLLAVSFLAATLRWGILYAAESAVAIVLSQLLHAVTYGAFHMAGILYMDELAPAADKTLGQAVNNAVTYGLGLTVGFFVSGVLFDAGNTAPLFLFSAGVSLVGGVLFAGYHGLRAS